MILKQKLIIFEKVVCPRGKFQMWLQKEKNIMKKCIQSFLHLLFQLLELRTTHINYCLLKISISFHPSNKSILFKLWNEKEGLAFSEALQSTCRLSAQHQLTKHLLVLHFKNKNKNKNKTLLDFLCDSCKEKSFVQ